MTEKESPQLKMLKLTLANLDWDNKGDEWDDSSFLPLPDPEVRASVRA